MDRTERFYRIDQMLRERTLVSLEDFLRELGVSRATFKRDLEYLRERLNAPIEYDRDNNGYRFVCTAATGPRYELPGLWFNASEIHALLTMQELLGSLDPGILKPHVDPLRARLNALLESQDGSAEEIGRRIRIARLPARAITLEFFELAASATLKRRRLDMTFWSRTSDETTERTVSPQRLIFYRGNWYLDAWCHLRNGIRSFALDGIQKAALLSDRAKDIDDGELDAFLASSYGIFNGPPKAWAKLRFSPTAARWVAHERWHSQQKAWLESDGSYVLELPYGVDQELVMDILKFGPNCTVEAPRELRERVAELASATASLYGRQA